MYIHFLKKIPSSLLFSFLSFITLLTISSVAGAQEEVAELDKAEASSAAMK